MSTSLPLPLPLPTDSAFSVYLKRRFLRGDGVPRFFHRWPLYGILFDRAQWEQRTDLLYVGVGDTISVVASSAGTSASSSASSSAPSSAVARRAPPVSFLRLEPFDGAIANTGGAGGGTLAAATAVRLPTCKKKRDATAVYTPPTGPNGPAFTLASASASTRRSGDRKRRSSSNSSSSSASAPAPMHYSEPPLAKMARSQSGVFVVCPPVRNWTADDVENACASTTRDPSVARRRMLIEAAVRGVDVYVDSAVLDNGDARHDAAFARQFRKLSATTAATTSTTTTTLQ